MNLDELFDEPRGEWVESAYRACQNARAAAQLAVASSTENADYVYATTSAQYLADFHRGEALLYAIPFKNLGVPESPGRDATIDTFDYLINLLGLQFIDSEGPVPVLEPDLDSWRTLLAVTKPQFQLSEDDVDQMRFLRRREAEMLYQREIRDNIVRVVFSKFKWLLHAHVITDSGVTLEQAQVQLVLMEEPPPWPEIKVIQRGFWEL